MNYMYSFCRKVVPVVAISACLLSSTAISASAAMLPAEQASVSLSSAGAEARMTLISECDCFISADGSMVYADASVSGYSGEVYYSILGLDTIVEKKKVRNYYE